MFRAIAEQLREATDKQGGSGVNDAKMPEPTRQALVNILTERIHSHILMDAEAARYIAEQSFLPPIAEFVEEWIRLNCRDFYKGSDEFVLDWHEEMS